MVEFNYVSYVDYTQNGGSANYSDENNFTDVPGGGTLSDAGGNATFDPGEVVNGGETGTFLGSLTDASGNIYLVLDTAAGWRIYSQVDAATTQANLDSLIQTGDVDQTALQCFVAGTRIAAPDGEVRVEELQPGDMILTADGRSVPVMWVGRSVVSTLFGPAGRLMPVRIGAGALGGGLPSRDLLVTADHALLVGGLLINAGALVNGTTIDWVPLSEFGDRFTVYHIETQDHDIILAEDAPAETFIDYVGRQSFDNYAEYVALYGEDRTIHEMGYPRISAARMVPSALKARLGNAKAA